MRYVIFRALIVGLVVLGTAAPALADSHIAGRCPPPFDALDRQQQYELADELGVPREQVDAVIERVDRNDDEVLCFMLLPIGHPNIIDNRLPLR